MLRISIFLIPGLLVLAGCNSNSTGSETATTYQLGEIDLEVSGEPVALPYFEKGLLLLHSFEYEDARAEFQKAQEMDADFAMAYWGEAMTYNQPIWHRQQYTKGQAAMKRLGANQEEQLAKAETPLEKDFIRSLGVLYGDGEKEDRDQAYADFMNNLYEAYPDNQEVAAFYALSLLGSVQAGRDKAVFEKGAGVAQGIIRENPEHPGALHYLIHSYDDPGHAPLALNAANNYSRIAPDAAHALHMPSHIYVAMGMWDEVITSNIASYEASVSRMNAKGLGDDARSFHAFHWLQYGYLQKGEFEKAEKILEEMVGYTASLSSVTARSYLVRMLGNFLVETGNWDHPLAETQVDLSDLNISHQAVGHFLEGYQAYRKADKDELTSIIDTLADKRQQASMVMASGGAPMCNTSSSWSTANKVEVKQAEVMEYELKALLWRLKGDHKKAEKYMVRAVNTQYNVDYSYGPPEIVYPAYEFYASYLLEKEDYKKALKMYEMAQERGPGRTLAINGESMAKENLDPVQ
jgi:tetratricopeptide (TPR) repeat protein